MPERADYPNNEIIIHGSRRVKISDNISKTSLIEETRDREQIYELAQVIWEETLTIG